MMKRLKNWVISLSQHKYAEAALALVSFTESSFFLVPPDVMLAPMVLANRAKAMRLAFICTLASVLGALFGYFIGMVLFDLIGQPILEAYQAQSAFDKFLHYYQLWGFWVVLISAVSFIPFKIATLASGVVAMNPIVFIIACVLGRGLRFFGVAFVLSQNPRDWLLTPARHLSLLWLGMLAVILAALGMQYIAGYQPCEMCLYQRWPYYTGLVFAPLLAVLIYQQKNGLYQHGLKLVSLIFFSGAIYAAYHAGVEWQWWAGPDSCGGTGGALNTIDDLMRSLETTKIVPCDEAAWRLFGISMAGYNALASFGLSVFALLPIYGARVLDKWKPQETR